MPPQIATVFFLFDLGDPETYSGLLDVIYYKQRTGKWPPIPPEPSIPPPVIVPPPPPAPPVVVPPPVVSKKVRVKPKMVGWIRTKPDPNSPSIRAIRYADGWWPLLESRTGWERISLGWVASNVLEYV